MVNLNEGWRAIKKWKDEFPMRVLLFRVEQEEEKINSYAYPICPLIF